MNFRNYLVGTVFLVLLIWGPIDHSWTAWLAIRTGYLILIPLAIWLIYGWLWNHFDPSDKLETTLERILSGLICIVLGTFAVLEATSKTHIGNTQWIRTRDGMEAVGDDVVLQGTDWGNVIVFGLFAILFMVGSLKKKGIKVLTKNNSQKSKVAKGCL